MRFLLPLMVGAVLLSACVPNRKVTLLQKNDVNQRDMPRDTVVRSYQPQTFDYRVQSNDILSVRFESLTPDQFDFLSRGGGSQQMNVMGGNGLVVGELVDENGEITFPAVGKVKVSGLTIFEIQDKLQQAADAYLKSPIVKVRLLNYRFTLLGEVPREGTIVLTNNRVNMLEAIGQAGGLGEFADRTKVKLVRQRAGKTEIQYINLLDEKFIESPYYYVNQNDVLIVPALRQRPFRRYYAQNLSIILSSLSVILVAFNLTR